MTTITQAMAMTFRVLHPQTKESVPVLGRNMGDKVLEKYLESKNPDAALAARVLLDESYVTYEEVDGVKRVVRVPHPTPPDVPDDDGFGPLGVTTSAPAKPPVMPKALVPQPKPAPAPWDAETSEWRGFEEGGDSQETGLVVSTHQELAPSIRPVGVESLPDFDNMQQDIPLNMKKFEFTAAGQELRGLYIGMQKMQKNGKPFDSAVFQRKDGLIWASGVDLTSKLAPIPTGTPVLVRFQGTKNLGNGNRLSLFDVFSLK